MSIRVLGVLETPMSQVVQNVPIKVVTSSGFGNVLTTSEAIYFTDNQGNYDFNLAFGTHELYVMFTDTFEHIGTTVANDSLADPSYTISELLYYTTPLPNENEQCIRDDFGGCISDLENAFDTCIVQLSQQVVQGDTGVRTDMTTYTNERLQACSAELTDTIVAGDAQVLIESQAYADATGAEISCCTNLLDTRLVDICSTLTAYTTSNDVAIACLCTDMDAGDAQVLQTAQAYSDTCNGITCSNLVNMVQSCDAAVQTCMEAISNADGLHQAGYEIVTTAGDASASIALVATSCTTSGVQESCILMQADKIIMHNGNPNTQSYPFQVVGNCVYMDAAYIRCLTGDKIKSNTTIKAGSGTNTAGMNGDDSGSDTSNRNRLYRFWAGGEYARTSGGVPCAPFRVTNTGALVASNAYITGCINTTCLVFCAPSAVPPEITNAQLTADTANDRAQQAQNVTNLLDMRPWVQGFSGGGKWVRNGDANENCVTAGKGPYTNGAMLWAGKTNTSTDSGPNGGWTYDLDENDGFHHSKTYVMTTWMFQSTSDGTMYLGTSQDGSIKALGGSTTTNPYFWSGDLPSTGKWYLVVGVVHGSGYTGTATNMAGVYDPITGSKVANGSEFQMYSSATKLRHRAYYYYSSNTSALAYFARPTVHTGEDFPGVDTMLNQAYQRAATACACGINCGNTAKCCAATALAKGCSACNCAKNCGNAAKTCANCACKCAINCANAACAFTESRIYPDQNSIQIKSGNYQAGVRGWAIDANGNSEFSNTVVRGTVYATNGFFCGTVSANCIDADVVATADKTSSAACISVLNALGVFTKSLMTGTIGSSNLNSNRTLLVDGIGAQDVQASGAGGGTFAKLWVSLFLDGTIVSCSPKLSVYTAGMDGLPMTLPAVAYDGVNSSSHTYEVKVNMEYACTPNAFGIEVPSQTVAPKLFRSGNSIT